MLGELNAAELTEGAVSEGRCSWGLRWLQQQPSTRCFRFWVDHVWLRACCVWVQYAECRSWSSSSVMLTCLQVSGIRFAFDPAKAAGHRIQESSVFVGVQPLVEDQQYTVVGAQITDSFSFS